jgi:hypothetical protein
MRSSQSILRAAIASSVALWGCAGSLDQPGRFGYLDAPPDAGTADTSSDMDAGCNPVTDIFPPSCTTSACHSAGSQQGSLDLESPGMPQRLVNKKAHGGPGLLIDAKDPAQSVLLLKLSDPPPFGFQMPLGAVALTDGEVACLQAWVQAAVAQ